MPDKMLIEREGSTPGLAIIDAYGAPAVTGEHGSLRIRLLGLPDHHTAPRTVLVAPSECEQLIEIAKTVMANAAAEKLRQSENPPPPPAPPFGPFPPGNFPSPHVLNPMSAPPPPPWPEAQLGGKSR